MALSDRLNPMRAAAPLYAALAPCLPDRLYRALAGRRRELLVIPDPATDGARAELIRASSQSRESLGMIARAEAGSFPALGHGGEGASGWPIVLLLPDSAILTRQVSLPAQVRANLARVMREEIDRLSPFRATEVLHDFTVREGPARAPRITVDLALCRRDQAADWIRRLAAAGAPIDRIRWAGAWPGANLLPAAERPKQRRVLLTPMRLLSALALLLTLAVLATPVWRKTWHLDDLQTRLRAARAQAVAVDDLRQELERARLGSTAVIQQKLAQPNVLEMLRELTERLPDDTWIQTLDYNDGQVDLRGESARATTLIDLLEQAPGIDQVAFKSPVTQVPRTGRERFNLAFRFSRMEHE